MSKQEATYCLASIGILTERLEWVNSFLLILINAQNKFEAYLTERVLPLQLMCLPCAPN